MLLVASLAVAACGVSAAPSPSPAEPTSGGVARPTRSVLPLPSHSARPTPSPTPTTPPSPTPNPTPSPTVTPAPTPTPVPTPPTAEALWSRVTAGVTDAGRLRLRVIGPAPGELRYVEKASATAIGGEVVFVCSGGTAYDGQSGWMAVPGAWSCGVDALVAGFRLTGQPLDAWSAELSPDEEIMERVELLGDGTWRWSYRGRSPFAGGLVRTMIVVDPASGQLRSASRSDPTGQTTYGISYAEAFPAIVVP